ncbi:unnamed protein product, partial [marine sediment metagenome]
LALYSINEQGLLQIKDLIEEFGIKSRLSVGYGCRRNVLALIIRDFNQFNKQIGFNLKRKQDKLNKIIESRHPDSNQEPFGFS